MKGLGQHWREALEDEDDMTPMEELAWMLVGIAATILTAIAVAGIVK